MLDAIIQKVEEEELRAAFAGQADDRFSDLMKSGAGIAWHDMRTYLNARIHGKPARAPKPRKWRR